MSMTTDCICHAPVMTTIGNYKRRRGELQKIGKHNDANELSIRNSSEIWV